MECRKSPRNTGNESPIARQRMAAGITQAQLAEAVGVKPQHIGRWERGERKPKLEPLMKIAKVIGCKVDDLL